MAALTTADLLKLGDGSSRADARTAALLAELVLGGGTFDYQAGVGAASVDPPADARLTSISVVPGPAGAAVAIGAGDSIPVPAGTVLDMPIIGATGDTVAITGDVASYVVTWVT